MRVRKYFLALLGAMLFALPALAQAAQPLTLTEEVLTYVQVDEKGVAHGDDARVELQRKGDRVALLEKRTIPSGAKVTLKVEIDPKTLLPLSWEKMQVENGGQIKVDLILGPDKIEARIEQPEKKVKQDWVARPSGPFTVVPLLKYYLAKRLEAGETAGTFIVVGVMGTELMAIEVGVEDKGVETVTVPAGSFACRHLRVEPLSALYSVVMPPADMYLAVDGTHPLVLGLGRTSRLSPVMRSELSSYKTQ